MAEEIKKRKRGRPRKSEIEAKKKRGKVGRPPGDAAIFNDYKARLLASPKSEAVLEELLTVAADSNHKNYAAAVKLVVERLMPRDYFQKDSQGGKKVEINLNFDQAPTSINSSSGDRDTNEPIDVEFSEVDDES